MKHSGFYIALISLVLAFGSCHKDGQIKPLPPNPSQPIDSDTADFTCLPLVNANGAIHDSDAHPNSVNAWEYNPADNNQVIYRLTNGQILSYNLVTRERHLLGDNCLAFMYTNRRGWVIFNKFDANIYKVKVNGDSLTQVTFAGNYYNPKWDYSDTAIYAYRDSPLNYTIKINSNGKSLDSIPGGSFSDGYSKVSNKRAYSTVESGQHKLFVMDLNTKTSILISEGRLFSNILFDGKDEYLFSADDSTITRHNIATHTSEVFLKSCPNNGFGVGDITPGNKMAVSWEKITYYAKLHHTYVHEYRCFEIDLNDPSRKLKEIKIYPK